MKLTDKLKDQILKLREQNLSYPKIQKKLNLPSNNLVRAVLDKTYRKRANDSTKKRYYKLKALGICHICGNKLKK